MPRPRRPECGTSVARIGRILLFAAQHRQTVLERDLGQVRCTIGPDAHAPENLPCTRCKAAL